MRRKSGAGATGPTKTSQRRDERSRSDGRHGRWYDTVIIFGCAAFSVVVVNAIIPENEDTNEMLQTIAPRTSYDIHSVVLVGVLFYTNELRMLFEVWCSSVGFGLGI